MLYNFFTKRYLLLLLFLALSQGAAARVYTLSNNTSNLPSSWQCSSANWEVRCSGDVTVSADDKVRVDNAIPDSEKPLVWHIENGASLTVEDGSSDSPACINASGTSPCSLSGGTPEDLLIKTDSDIVLGQFAKVVANIESSSEIDASQNSAIKGNLKTTNSGDGQITLNQDVTLQGTIDAKGSVDVGQGGFIQGSITAQTDIDTGQNSVIEGGLTTTVKDDGQITLNQNTKVGGEISSAEDVDIGQGSTVQDDVTARTQIDTGENFKIDGTIRTKTKDDGDVDLDEDGKVTGNLIAQGDISVEQNTLVKGDTFAECQSVDISGTVGGCSIAGNVDASDGTVKGGIIESCGDVEEKNLSSGTPELAGLSGQTTRATGDIKIYQARYNGKKWNGDLKAIPVSDDFRANVNNTNWNARKKMKTPADREIYTYDQEFNAGQKGAEFKWTKLDSDQKAQLTKPGEPTLLGQNLVKYLRGDRSNEGDTANDFRERTGVLGPIINSTPALSKGVDYEFDKGANDAFGNDASGVTSSYEGHVDSTNRVVYVGANDGMLHAFDANNGEELFAYVPDTAYDKFREFAEADEASPGAYRHYFVDASPKIAHAHFNEWTSILLGSGGAGGQSVFALDVNNPDEFAGSDVLWEFKGKGHPEDMGHSIGQPSFARLSDGRWVAVFGNGYGTGEAKLFIINLKTGALIKKVDMTSADDDNKTPNGLVGVTPFDKDGDRIADWIYAGDLQGNLWKYDVQGKQNKWGFATKKGNPVFSAGLTKGGDTQSQPITAPPVVGPAPTPGDFMVYFGTGEQMRQAGDHKPFEAVSEDDDQQAFYAVRDPTDGSGGLTRADLQQQEIKEEVNGGSGAKYRVLTDNEVNYKKEEGWFIDLPAHDGNAGGITRREVVVDAAQIERGLKRPRVVFNSLVSGSGSCNLGSDSWLMEADAYTGGPLEKALFDVDGDGEINANDAMNNGTVHATGRKMNAVTSQPLILGGGSGTETLLMGDSTGGIQEVDQSTQKDGREGWLQLK